MILDIIVLITTRDSKRYTVYAAQLQEALALSPSRHGWLERRQIYCSVRSSPPQPRSGGPTTPWASPQSSAGEALQLAQLPRQAQMVPFFRRRGRA